MRSNNRYNVIICLRDTIILEQFDSSNTASTFNIPNKRKQNVHF